MTSYSMLREHANALIKNRVFLIKNIKISATLLSELAQDRIVTGEMSEEITSVLHPTSRDKVASLLDLLPKRGPKAFSTFIRALVETEHDHVAQLLDAGLANAFIQERSKTEGYGVVPMDTQNTGPIPTALPPAEQGERYDVIPTEITEQNLMKINMVPIDMKNKWTQQITQSAGCYPMKKSQRGLALIICNEYFIAPGFTERDGADFDITNICQLLESLNFETKTHKNVTADGLKVILEEERGNTLHRNANAFLCFIMSHGTQGFIYCTDGKKLSITEEIASKFDGKNCPALINKPKLFFIQACQGNAVSTGQKHQDVTDARSPPSSLEPQISQNNLEKQMAELKIQDSGDSVPAFKSSDHEKSDFLFAYATVPGYKAWRHSALGSWFIRTIVYVFSKDAHHEHITDLLTQVRKLMSKMRTMHTDESYMQITETRDTLMKKLYFLPGHVDDN